ncbi:MAG: 2-amino-4-hydroxy-6-hydroxymethyldihydropteridine diphosphokinase [Lachnospiraceae bacterium]|nr:2-amino-4-hydroxy-6-hydroxymethyldihydropteridine diphosphokinase [Lachnospiraceae bacterium]
MSDVITLKGIKVFANHGVFEFEKERGQEFLVDITMKTNLCKPQFSDELSDTINYATVSDVVSDFVKNTAFNLIEKVAYELSKEILIRFNTVEEVNIKLHKPNAPLEVKTEDVIVDITNKWNLVYIGVGSNIGDKVGNIKKALCQLENDDMFREIVCTELIKTKPYGGVKQDDFMNGVIKLRTIYNPYELLKVLHDYEHEAGRERSIHWGPRTLDLDILFYEDYLIDSEELKIPHIDMENRLFELEPLMQMCPLMYNRRTGSTVEDMYYGLKKQDKKKKKK